MERRNVAASVVFAHERAVLEDQVLDLLDMIPDAETYNGIQTFLDFQPTETITKFDKAVELFQQFSANGKRSVVEAFSFAQGIAEEFVDFKTDRFSAFRSADRNLGRYKTFEGFLTAADGFKFDTFKTTFEDNVKELAASSVQLEQLAEKSRLEAQRASLLFDQQRVNEVVGQNAAVISYYQDLRDDAVAEINRLATTLPHQYVFVFQVLGLFNYVRQGNWRIDPRYQTALSAKSVANRDLAVAQIRNRDATRDARSLQRRLDEIDSRLDVLVKDLGDNEAGLQTLKQTLDDQYQFLRALSPIAIEVFGETRGDQAGVGFGNESSLLSELLQFSENYTIDDSELQGRFFDQHLLPAGYLFRSWTQFTMHQRS